MHINKLLLAHALGLALSAAAPQPVKPRVGAGDNDPKPEPPALPPPGFHRLKGTPPNPARMTKAQRKAAKRERRNRVLPANDQVQP